MTQEISQEDKYYEEDIQDKYHKMNQYNEIE